MFHMAKIVKIKDQHECIDLLISYFTSIIFIAFVAPQPAG